MKKKCTGARTQIRLAKQEGFMQFCSDNTLPTPVVEYRFFMERRWRFDYAWPLEKIALEVEGGIWTRGRHVRGTGFLADSEKYNCATLLGWRVVRTTPDALLSDATRDLLQKLFRVQT